MGIQTVSLIIAAFVSGSLGIASAMRNFRSRLCLSFTAMAALLLAHDAMGVIESFDSAMKFSSPRLHALTILLLGPATLWFLEEIVPQYKKRIRRFAWLYVPILAFFLFAMELHLFRRMTAWFAVSAQLLFVFPAAIWLFTLAYAESSSRLTRERLRLRYAFWGGAITTLFFLTDALNFAGVAVPPLGTLARTLYVIFLFQTFIQKELMTSEEVVAKISLLGGLAVILSSIYALLVSWVGSRPGLFFFNTFIASFVILVLFDPIRNLTSKFTRRVLLRKNQMVEDELNSLSLELLGSVIEPPELAEEISRSLKRCLGVDACSLYMLERDGLGFVRVNGGGNERFTYDIPTSDPIIEYMTLRRGRPFVLETIENDRDSFSSIQPRRFCQSCLETMREHRFDFVIPFLYESKIIGFCGVTTGERILLSNEQLRLFIPLARQIATLLKNTQLLTSLRDRDKLAAVGEMAAGLAHEIKNPLGSIKGAAELLKESMPATDGTSSEFLSIITAEVDRLSSVLTEFLDYAKPRKNYPQVSCDPLKVVEHTAALVLRDSNIRLDIHSDKKGWAINADPDILKQVLLNLFLNAVEAMENEVNPRIMVRLKENRPKRGIFGDSIPLLKVWEGWDARKVAPQCASLELEIGDNGSGISSEDRANIFVPFFTTKPRGTGLGLAVCQKLVESMGGSISVRSNVPKGTIFTIHVPIRDESKDLRDETVVTRLRAEELPT